MVISFLSDFSESRSGFEIETKCTKVGLTDSEQCDEVVDIAGSENCILFVPEQVTQHEAVNVCRSHNAELPVPLSNEENDALRKIMDRNSLKRE